MKHTIFPSLQLMGDELMNNEQLKVHLVIGVN